MEFQHRLYGLRKKAGLSQEELAGLLGVTRQAVQKWEAGTSRPDMDNLIALARYFNVTLDWLLTGQETAPPEPAARTVINNYYTSWRYEYKSRRTLFGLPLVHIHLGRGFQRARGVIAIGNVATGVVSLGIFAAGIVSVGCLTVGLLTLGCIALGLLSLGCIAVGAAALGGVTLGILSIGGVAFGTYAVGGAACAAQIAIGGMASAPLAIGDDPSGAVALFLNDSTLSREAVRTAVTQALGGPGWLADLLTFLACHSGSVPLR